VEITTRNAVDIVINQQMQLFAVNFISLQGHCTCFGCFPHPSSGVY